MTPACFDSAEQYEEWVRLAQIAQVHPRIGSDLPNFCQDCTECYKTRMVEAGRCEFPLTRFTRVMEPDAGSLPAAEETVGFEGREAPTSGDYLLSKVRRQAAGHVSHPVSVRTPAGCVGSPRPSPTLAELLAPPTVVGPLLYTEPSDPPAAAPSTGSEPAQS